LLLDVVKRLIKAVPLPLGETVLIWQDDGMFQQEAPLQPWAGSDAVYHSPPPSVLLFGGPERSRAIGGGGTGVHWFQCPQQQAALQLGQHTRAIMAIAIASPNPKGNYVSHPSLEALIPVEQKG
jgi:hypothetical protein